MEKLEYESARSVDPRNTPAIFAILVAALMLIVAIILRVLGAEGLLESEREMWADLSWFAVVAAAVMAVPALQQLIRVR